MKFNHKSYPEIALHFNITFPATIFTWERKLENLDLNSMKYKHKSQNQDVFINEQSNQIKALTDNNLVLSIQNRYQKLIITNSVNTSISALRRIFKQVSLTKILSAMKIPRSSHYYAKKTAFSKQSIKVTKAIHEMITNNNKLGQTHYSLFKAEYT